MLVRSCCWRRCRDVVDINKIRRSGPIFVKCVTGKLFTVSVQCDMRRLDITTASASLPPFYLSLAANLLVHTLHFLLLHIPLPLCLSASMPCFTPAVPRLPS